MFAVILSCNFKLNKKLHNCKNTYKEIKIVTENLAFCYKNDYFFHSKKFTIKIKVFKVIIKPKVLQL